MNSSESGKLIRICLEFKRFWLVTRCFVFCMHFVTHLTWWTDSVLQVNCRNPWFREFWAKHHRCGFGGGEPRCSGREDVTRHQQEGLVPFVSKYSQYNITVSCIPCLLSYSWRGVRDGPLAAQPGAGGLLQQHSALPHKTGGTQGRNSLKFSFLATRFDWKPGAKQVQDSPIRNNSAVSECFLYLTVC